MPAFFWKFSELKKQLQTKEKPWVLLNMKFSEVFYCIAGNIVSRGLQIW